MVFTFGKYAGYHLSQIPASYLGLALEGFTMPESLCEGCRMELARRFGLDVQSRPQTQTEQVNCHVKIRQVYAVMARKYHPDRNGSNEAMAAINEFYEALKQ